MGKRPAERALAGGCRRPVGVPGYPAGRWVSLGIPYDGTGVIRVMVTRFYDADGFLVEFNQPLDRIQPSDLES